VWPIVVPLQARPEQVISARFIDLTFAPSGKASGTDTPSINYHWPPVLGQGQVRNRSVLAGQTYAQS
jgi:hypothetical protein